MKRSLNLWLSMILLVTFNLTVNAQGNSVKTDLPKGWHLLDKDQDGYFGISLNKAYEFAKQKKLKSKTVIVAVIDSGIDTLHEDLKGILWTNPKEIPGNGIDDDGNGYVDDVHGWDFIGNENGQDLSRAPGEGTRVFYEFKSKYFGKQINEDSLNDEEKFEYETWKRA